MAIIFNNEGAEAPGNLEKFPSSLCSTTLT